MDRSTILAWLSLTSAVGGRGTPADDPLALFEQCPLPLAIIDLRDRALTAASPRFTDALGLDGAAGTPLTALVPNPDRVEVLCDMLLDGVLDTFENRRTLRRCDGTGLETTAWVSVIDLEQRRRALWVLAPAGQGHLAPVPLPARSAWPQTVDGVVVGVLDATLRVEEISRGVERALGYRRDEVIGQPAVRFVHDDDVHVLLTAIANAVAEQAGVGAQLRIRDRDDRWRRMHAVVVPLDSQELRIGYSLVPVVPEAAGSAERIHELERRLRRIAGEVESSGIGIAPPEVPDADALPELADLSPRQWEVLARLVRGERVPGIARALFLSQSTVRNHLTAVYRQLGVNSQEELLAVVRRRRVGAP